jgi:hypothetical protein
MVNGHTLESGGSIPAGDTGNLYCHRHVQSTVFRDPQDSPHQYVSGEYKWPQRSSEHSLDNYGFLIHQNLINSGLNQNSKPYDIDLNATDVQDMDSRTVLLPLLQRSIHWEELVAYFPFIPNGPHTKRGLQKFLVATGMSLQSSCLANDGG